MKRYFLLLIALAAILIAPTACANRSTGRSRLIYGLTLAPSGIDPHVNASSELGIPLTSVYDTLVFKDPESGDFVPGLAEDWEITNEGTTYTFWLREDVVFHDGTPFNADAVRFNLERITSNELASQKARFMLGPYDRTEVLDEYTVRVHLREPFAPLLDSLSQVYLGMASPAAIEEWGSEYQLHQVGTGPFIFAEYSPRDRLLLRRNPDYAWSPSVYENEQAQLEEIEFRFFVDPATRSPALETGQAHVMGEIPPQDVERLESADAFDVKPVPIPGASLMFFLNTQRAPLDEAAVRQALLYATNRQAIVNTAYYSTSPVAYGPLAAATFGYEPRVREYYAYDPDQARELLEQAGWSSTGEGDLREREGERLHLDVYVMPWGYVSEVGQLLAAQWSEVGVDVELHQVTYSEALTIANEGEHHAIPFNLSSTDPDILRSFFHSQAVFNWSRIQDETMDQWLETGARTLDPEERGELYSQVQLRVMERALIIPIRDYVNQNGTSSRVDGLRFSAQGWFPWLIDVRLEAE